MLKDKEKAIEVKIKNEDGTEKTVNIIVKKPNNVAQQAAQRVAAKVWTECIRDEIMTKKELEEFMKTHNIWNKDKEKQQKDIITSINDMEKQLYVGSKGKRLTKSEGKRIAIEMRVKRGELRDLIAERMSLEQNTAESLSDNARFDYLVSACTYYENGEKVYKDVEEYSQRADDEIAFKAATALAQMMYSVDKDFEAKLPENKFLKMFNFVNEDLSLVNSNGETVDTTGKRIDSNGYYLDDDGNRIDKDGNKLDENGNYILAVEFVDEEESVPEQESGEAPKKSRKKATDS